MSMNEFRQLAARIDQQMQRLTAEGVSEWAKSGLMWQSR